MADTELETTEQAAIERLLDVLIRRVVRDELAHVLEFQPMGKVNFDRLIATLRDRTYLDGR